MKNGKMMTFFKAALIGAVCTSGMSVAIAQSEGEMTLNVGQSIFELNKDKTKDKVVIIPTQGCPMEPCPGEQIIK
ncbi:hypothetical protein [Shewanella woodyi]|uniref:Uncharacterized protein n=1 Tax=Shewanella woodyi (strain ATCC 51908 / MS32) TaxID=392500 RepID=B1KFP6_SHEWM|nr:hypothetical protein [Shewanella woodyi]ACA85212.1 hypothetical protein Swoo_0919 [Shewanella woodyi ATCC 51908]